MPMKTPPQKTTGSTAPKLSVAGPATHVQNASLAALRGSTVIVRLCNSEAKTGLLVASDAYTLLLRINNAHEVLFFKHAVVSVELFRPVK